MSRVSETGGKLETTVALVATPNASNDYIRVLAPLGLQLVHGIRLIIDDEKIVHKMHHCRAEGCVANVVDLKIAEKMRRAKDLTVQMIKADGSPLSVKFSMNNFKAVEANKLVSLKTREGIDQDKIDFDVFLSDPPKSTVTEPITVPLAMQGWAKSCVDKVCFTGMDGSIGTGQPLIAAVFIEPEGDKKRLLRITFPLKMYFGKKPEFTIEGFTPLTAEYVICFKN
ncbi:MAG: invasion associated locus B family protein, partial [Prosthecobacter sp.]|nr:invasion associated locus B family protein [Prosthecobacter sp.]